MLIVILFCEHSQKIMSDIEEALRRHQRNPNQSLAPIISAIKVTDTSALLSTLPRIPSTLVQMVFDREPSKRDVLYMIEKDPSVYCAFLRRYPSVNDDEFKVLLTYLKCNNFEVVSEVLLVVEHFMTNQFGVRGALSCIVGVEPSHANY